MGKSRKLWHNFAMINMDFTETVMIDTQSQDWVSSASPGVWRKPLAREAAERGHVTSVVRFDPRARLAQHDHSLGEEILVLKGTLSDEYGDYPAGSYMRSPPGFSHSSYSDQGCELFIKLHQFQPGDRQQIHVDTLHSSWLPGVGQLQVMPLHEFNAEHTALVLWPAGDHPAQQRRWGGEEIFVVAGELIDPHGHYRAGTWMRGPSLNQHPAQVEQDTVIWLKTGHLAPL